MGRLIKFLSITVVLSMVFPTVFCSCNNNQDDFPTNMTFTDAPHIQEIPTEEYTWGRIRKRKISDDGWVTTFSYTVNKDGTTKDEEDFECPFNFCAVNLRYRFGDQNAEGGVIQILGEGNNELIKSDMAKIAEYLGYDGERPSKEEILNAQPGCLGLQAVDENLFFELAHEALTAEYKGWGQYASLPSYALLAEPDYIDGYKFQVGFENASGKIDVIMIDILYQTGDGIRDYDQLFDLVKDDSDYLDAYNTIIGIQNYVTENNDLAIGKYLSGIAVPKGIDWSRLVQFLNDIADPNNISSYRFRNY